MNQPQASACPCGRTARTCPNPAPPGQTCAECTAGRHDHHLRYRAEPFRPQPEFGVMYYRYRTSRDMFKLPTLTPDSAEAEAIFAGQAKLLSCAVLRVDWATGTHTWRFAKRVPAEIRQHARIKSALHPNTVPYTIGVGAPSTREFREAFPSVPLLSDCQTTDETTPPSYRQETA